jgi:hypothetical protein
MKIRHIKRRAKRPEFRITTVNGTKMVGVYTARAVERFFGTTEEEDARAREFFGVRGQ